MTVIQQGDKDRRSRMVISSVKQPAKKGGGGGPFNWGTVSDYGPVDVHTCMLLEATAPPSKVMVVPAPQLPAAIAQPIQTMPAVTDTKHFPVLSLQSPAPQPAVWGPSHAFAPSSVKTSPDQLRSGSRDLFDAQHPRNQFARKPHSSATGQAATMDEDKVPQYAVDWSAPGTIGVFSTILHQSNNPAHLSPYIKAEPPMLLTNLKQLSQQSAAKLAHQQPKLCRHSGMGKPVMSRQPGMVLQARGR